MYNEFLSWIQKKLFDGDNLICKEKCIPDLVTTLSWEVKTRSVKENEQSSKGEGSRIICVRPSWVIRSLITVPSAVALSWSNQTLVLALKSPKTRLKKGFFEAITYNVNSRLVVKLINSLCDCYCDCYCCDSLMWRVVCAKKWNFRKVLRRNAFQVPVTCWKVLSWVRFWSRFWFYIFAENELQVK